MRGHSDRYGELLITPQEGFTQRMGKMKYEPKEDVVKKLDNNFCYHTPKDGQAERYVEIRDEGRNYAYLLSRQCPPSRELSVALTALEDCVMWANASIARNE